MKNPYVSELGNHVEFYIKKDMMDYFRKKAEKQSSTPEKIIKDEIENWVEKETSK